MENHGSENPDRLWGADAAGRYAPPADAYPAPAQPARGRTRRSLGRMLATPTFAAGVGIIIAAAFGYSTTQTHLVFSGREPACAVASCTRTSVRPDAGQPLKSTDRPEHRASSASAGGRQAADSAGTDQAGRSSSVRTGQPAGSQHTGSVTPHAPAISYKTIKRWRGGFDAAITLTNRGKVPIRGWQLWLRYRTNQISHVWHAAWFPANFRAPASGLIVPRRGEQVLKPGAVYHFEFQASGPAGTPIGCLFNGYHCTFTR